MLNIVKIACVFLFLSVTVGAVIYGVLSAFDPEESIVYIFSPQDSPGEVNAPLSDQISAARSAGFVTGFLNFLTIQHYWAELRDRGNTTQSFAYWFLYHQSVSKMLSYTICGLYYVACILLVFMVYKLIRYFIARVNYIIREAKNGRNS